MHTLVCTENFTCLFFSAVNNFTGFITRVIQFVSSPDGSYCHNDDNNNLLNAIIKLLKISNPLYGICLNIKPYCCFVSLIFRDINITETHIAIHSVLLIHSIILYI